MFPRFGHHLTLVLCLTVQVMALPCVACPCMQSREVGTEACVAGEAEDSGQSGCRFCQTKPDAWTSARLLVSERQVRLLAATAHATLLLDSDTFVRTAANLSTASLASREVPELQVFLE